MSSSILCSSPSRVLLETDRPRARADVVDDAEGIEIAFEWGIRDGVLRFVGRKCCCWCSGGGGGGGRGKAGRGIVGGGADGAGRAVMYVRRVGRRLYMQLGEIVYM